MIPALTMVIIVLYVAWHRANSKKKELEDVLVKVRDLGIEAEIEHDELLNECNELSARLVAITVERDHLKVMVQRHVERDLARNDGCGEVEKNFVKN